MVIKLSAVQERLEMVIMKVVLLHSKITKLKLQSEK